MIIKLARIDDRFIHGQFLTRWINTIPAERIIVVSDEVAKDPIRKKLVLSVAPSNFKTSAVSIEKMLRAYNSPKYTDTSVILLFEKPKDIVYLIEGGMDISEVNVGGMRFEAGNKQVTKSVNVSDDDIEMFLKLNDMGVALEMRQLPSDSKVDFISLVKELS
ncbi:PTS system mannose/fructose/N-acetylgalactosamine-transporter subunit IIB [Aerococcus urinae]|uniref:PTS system mannose/fructose/N-acetylgalactosamine-transporter subunit IIB n=1 Tax=Aerococcus urinae TaxID=1376 RepID=UPI0018E0F4A3|nr:PTS system mannose/fructose/N-acetylgalactosamine-transporter subunit IIB [Aerococcus urinae]